MAIIKTRLGTFVVAFPFGIIRPKSRIRSILGTHELVWRVIKARDHAEIDRAMAIAVRCWDDSKAHHVPELVTHWEGILREQVAWRQLWRPPAPARGRPRGRGNFRDAEDFRATMVDIMKPMELYDIEEIAAFMRRNSLRTQSDNIDSIVRMLYRYAERYQINLPDLFTTLHRA